ncbi:MAG: ribonuclease P protein component [Chitinophagaceae bacterium]
MPGKFIYPRKEKLKSRKLIGKVFKEANSFSVFPLKVLYIQSYLPANIFLQTGFTVGSKNFPKAVHRNRIKRLMREAYRLESYTLKEILKHKQLQIVLFFIFTGRSLPTQEILQNAMHTAFNELLKRFHENADKNS